MGFEEVETLKSHTGSVNCLAVASGTSIFASGSADATIKVWGSRLKDGHVDIDLLQSIHTNPRFFPLALAMSELGTSGSLMLAVAGTKGFVQIYVTENQKVFYLQATLMGHEGWIRSLAVVRERNMSNDDLLLASASQDKYIRLWRIREGEEVLEGGGIRKNFLVRGERSLSNKAHRLEALHKSYSLTFEALLLGHEDWVYTVSWRTDGERLQLLSASADSSLAFWEPEVSSGVWVCTTRLGEMSAQKGSTTATGSAGGFWNGLWSPSGKSVVSLGRAGSWRLWDYDREHDRWVQGVGISGHTKPLTDLAWAKDGTYLLSTGSDQTTRLHAQWERGAWTTWHELARPQIHGYDLNCLDSTGRTQFISGADEKLLRVFDEPRNTADLLYSLCGVSPGAEQDLPDAASIPVLGLSNKVIEYIEAEKSNAEPYIEEHQHLDPETTSTAPISLGLDRPPIEDQLARHTLWPEREKLYGHGYEISAVASSHKGTVIATGCKASSIEHAVVRLYSTKDWREIKPSLTAHSLTVTCLRFSKDDRYLLSVGRDRRWAVFEREDFWSEVYMLKYTNPKGHSRMILSASWTPLDVERVFATAGRDKAVRIWKIQQDGVECLTTITALSPVTAVDILPRCIQDAIIVAVGSENCDVSIYTLDLHSFQIRVLSSLDDL